MLSIWLKKLTFFYIRIVKEQKRVMICHLSHPFSRYFSEKNGGGERARTDGLLRARQALSQLSYTPKEWWAWMELNHRPHAYQACALTKLSYRP